ncbi:unnamed protein product [Adineta ricciae]|uniref:NAD(P)(+)--arginine ADP-ribosyltransferase n=2 Tax=Adineta ricciae TaxID=249248 RepID=A0A814ZN56_ADIRI|nr:unnamed protein product [Adineta ricciae]
MGKQSSKLVKQSSSAPVENINKVSNPLKNIVEASNQIISKANLQTCIIGNVVIVWLDQNINESSDNYRNSIHKLRKIVNSIEIFQDKDKCIKFIREIRDEKIFLIVSGSLGQQITSTIHELPQLHSIYIFCYQKSLHEQWAKKFHKIAGVFTEMNYICLIMTENVRLTNNDLIPISAIPKSSTADLNTLDPMFMYSKLIKEIILEMKYEKKVPEEFIEFCSSKYSTDKSVLKSIEEFKSDYCVEKSVQWYTKECFIYPMLNKALRTLDNETIYQMGFFIQGLLQQIKQIHSKEKYQSSFIVWRGQGISSLHFEKLKSCTGGLLSFNSFLSTSRSRRIAWKFVSNVQKKKEEREDKALLFQIKVDPSISQTPFADIDDISHHYDEKEILFSMHTVFQIDGMNEIESSTWEINLTLTTDNDPQLKRLTDCVRKEIEGETSLHRLGNLMYKMGKFDKASEIYEKLVDMTANSDHKKLAYLHHQLGSINSENHDLKSALFHYKESLRLYLSCLSADDSQLSATYSNIGLVLQKQGELNVALEHFKRALTIDLKASHPDQCKIATHYNNIAGILKAQGKYDEALKKYEESLNIRLQQYPPGHPSLAIAYNNLGGIHCSLRNYSDALAYYRKTLEIRQKSLPFNHPSLAITHSNIAMTLEDLSRFKEAIEHAEKAVDIAKLTYATDHSVVQGYRQQLEKLRQKVT